MSGQYPLEAPVYLSIEARKEEEVDKIIEDARFCDIRPENEPRSEDGRSSSSTWRTKFVHFTIPLQLLPSLFSS